MNELAIQSTLSLLRDLELGGALTPISLELPDGTSLERTTALFTLFGRLSTGNRFWIGDLICWGEGRYGDRIYQAADATGLSPGTLQNYASVCGRVAPERRRNGLSFGYHEAVASLEPAEQDRWLGLVEEKGWTREDLRGLLRDEGLIAPKPQPEWSGLGDGERGAAPRSPTPSAAPTPEPTGSGREDPPPPALEPGPGPDTPHPSAVVLARLRDRYEKQIDELGPGGSNVTVETLELERDAINWALGQLAPGLA